MGDLIKNTAVPEPVHYITEDEAKAMEELELDIAVRYCVEYAKQEALGVDKDDSFEKKKDFSRSSKKEIPNDGLVLEDVEIDWKNVEARQKEVKQKVINWLVSEKKI